MNKTSFPMNKTSLVRLAKVEALILALFVFLASGCKQTVSPNKATSGGFPLSDYISLGDIHAAGIDTTAIDGALWFSVENDQGNDTGASAGAVFGDSARSKIVGVSSVSVNSQALTQASGGSIYNNMSNAVFNSASPTSASWSVSGYQGGSLTDAATVPALMNVTNLSPGDTVSASSGFTVDYTNHAGGDLLATASFDGTFTRIWGDSAISQSGHGGTSKYSTDNGSISFSSSDLSGITTGGFISVVLVHYEYHVNKSGPLPVGVLSSSAMRIPLFLKP